MKLILLATRTGKEFRIKTDLPTDLALLRFKLETKESVRHYNDDYCGDANEATHYDYLYLSTEVADDTPENDWDVPEPIPCSCCGGSGYF